MDTKSEIGTQVVVRQARYRDGESVGGFLAGLSPISRYRRFFSGFTQAGPSLLRSLVTITPRQLVLLALDGDVVVGHVMAVCVGEHTVDVGIVVAEAYQHRGIGDRLLRELTDTLAGFGVTDLHCDVLSENYLVLNWLHRLLPDAHFERTGPTMTVHGSLVPQAA